jgi:hypothetical protein
LHCGRGSYGDGPLYQVGFRDDKVPDDLTQRFDPAAQRPHCDLKTAPFEPCPNWPASIGANIDTIIDYDGVPASSRRGAGLLIG